MQAMKFRKKPVVIEAIQFDGTEAKAKQIIAWSGDAVSGVERYNAGLLITTLEGIMRASVGDWVIKGVNGEFYPCKPDIFGKTYEQSPTGEE